MQALGIIGGLGPESTVDYYKLIIARYRARSNGSYPSIIINSLDLNKGIALVSAGELSALAEYIAGGIEKLRAAGCDVALIAANTPHIAFAEIQQRSSLPLLSIVETALEATKKLGVKRVGLLGTGFTMGSDFYQRAFSACGVEIIVPNGEERAFIHEKYLTELLQGVFLPETRGQLLKIIDRMTSEEHIQALILAGTELPLILRDAGSVSIPFLDTTQIHVEAAVSMLLRDVA